MEKQFISFQQIVKEIKELELENNETMYFNEFLNILYREELLSYDVEQHEAFIKSNRDYIESLKQDREHNQSKFVIVVYLRDMYNELKKLNRSVGLTTSNKNLELIEEYESISGQEKELDNGKKAVFLIDMKYKNKKEIIISIMDVKKNPADYSPYEDRTVYREVINTFRRPVAYLKALQRGLEAFDQTKTRSIY
ncbi:hypothetical protein [Escherichia coli]|uniref:hypothetical protein n=1 Tax=Escherichia coli TaxID=562 RepID=UPI0028630687|nr:hypothetical protein [Escherichia coli]